MQNPAFLNHRQVSHFLAIVECGSLSRAALELNISEPAISKSVRLLEASLGVKLFDREPRGLVLTVFGVSLADHARVVMTELRRAVEDINQLRNAEVGHAYIGATPTYASLLLPTAISSLVLEQPDLRVTVSEGLGDTLIPKLLQGELDFFISAFDASFAGTEVTVEALFTDTACVMTRAENPIVARKALTLDELAKSAWMLTPRGDYMRQQIDEHFAAGNYALQKPTIIMGSIGFGLKFLLSNDVLAFLPRHLLAREIAAGLVNILPEPCPTIERSVGLVRRRRGSLSPAARAAMSEIRKTAQTFQA
jgi:DNA-binding transcriptional LysR family regulator